MRTVVTDVDLVRPNDGEHCTVYFRQGQLAGNMLVPQKDVDKQDESFIKAAQAYLDAHKGETPRLAELPDLAEAGTVTRYLVQESQNSTSGMVFVENDMEEIADLVAELQARDLHIKTFADALESLETDLQKFSGLRDCIEYCSPDEHGFDGEAVILGYGNLGSSFASRIDVTRDKLIYVDTSDISDFDFQRLCNYMERGTDVGQEYFGTVYAGDVCIDIESSYNQQEDRPDIKFTCMIPSQREPGAVYGEMVEGFPYEEFHDDFGLREAIEVEVCAATKNFELFKMELQSQLELYAQELIEDNFPQKGLDALLSRDRFWQCMRAKENWPDFTVMPSPADFAHTGVGERYDDVELIPPGFHDETEPGTDTYPLIADDDCLLYIEEDFWHREADINTRYRLVLKDAEMSCQALDDLASACPVRGAIVSSNRFDAVYRKAKELLPKMREARKRLDAMREAARDIRAVLSLDKQFMKFYWNAYNSPTLTGKDDHEAACCQAIRNCLYNGATQSQLLQVVDSKAPMAVWEKDGQYAVRTVGEVNREREAAKEKSAGRNR